MFDSPITLLLLGISAASAIASYTAHRRRKRLDASALTNLTDADLLAALTALQSTTTPGGAQRHTEHGAQHSASVMHSHPEMRDLLHPESVSPLGRDTEVRRRITLLVIEEIERRSLAPASFR